VTVDPAAPVPPDKPQVDGAGATVTAASRLSEHLRGGGVIAPILTTILAFLVGGLVVLATGHEPIGTYREIFNGTGLNWFEPWLSSADRSVAAINLQQTLITTTPLILTGLAVAYAFRAGLFNIGAQGQYMVGSIIAVYAGSSWAGMTGWLHIVLCIVCAALAGAAWAGIAGVLRATAGANEVITTIMLNWIAVWTGVYLFGLGGPLQSDTQRDVPISNDVVPDARLHVFWGDAELQGLHIGIFIAIAGALVFWVVLNRSTRGYEARAVGFNPEAAAYSGISVAKTYVRVMATCGAFAGIAGALDVLGWQFHLATNDIQISQVGFIGIAVALLGRNTAIGTCFAALLFGALQNGTSVRHLDPSVFPPELAVNLTGIIQGVVVLLVSADILVVYLLRTFRRRRAAGGSGGAGDETAVAVSA
jgi:simple sugar transport system permease protein